MGFVLVDLFFLTFCHQQLSKTDLFLWNLLCWAAERSYCSPLPRWELASSHNPIGSLSLDSEMQEQTRATGTCLKGSKRNHHESPFIMLGCQTLSMDCLPLNRVASSRLQRSPYKEDWLEFAASRANYTSSAHRNRWKAEGEVTCKKSRVANTHKCVWHVCYLPQISMALNLHNVNRNEIKSKSASHKNVLLNGIDFGRSMSSMSRICCESRQRSDAAISPSFEQSTATPRTTMTTAAFNKFHVQKQLCPKMGMRQTGNISMWMLMINHGISCFFFMFSKYSSHPNPEGLAAPCEALHGASPSWAQHSAAAGRGSARHQSAGGCWCGRRRGCCRWGCLQKLWMSLEMVTAHK